MSVDFYDRNAEAFFAGTVDADMTAARERFLSHVRGHGHLLDAGCGSGRDARAFAEVGYTVTAFDASGEMVRLAREHARLPVRQMTFDDVAWVEEFDGVWASASLLHVARIDLPAAMSRLATSLRPGGVLYVSMKLGSTEREVEGRTFTDVLPEELDGLFESAGLGISENWISGDVRPGRDNERWVNTIGRKPTR